MWADLPTTNSMLQAFVALKINYMRLLIGPMALILLFSYNLSAQIQQINACTGDTVFLHPAQYHGDVFWQSSTDTMSWNTLLINSDTLAVTDDTDMLYRAFVKDGSCDSVVTDTASLRFFPSPSPAIAGSDQLLLQTISTNLTASPITTGTGTWSILSGTGGIIADTHNPQTLFTGVGANSYVLMWTVANECRTTTDTVNISFDMPKVNCSGVMYVHPTDNHGGSIWGCNGTVTNATSPSNGEQNTNIIVAACNDLTIAARRCSDLTAYGYSDWYLPSINELECIYNNKATIGGFPTISGIVYWSSTETNGTWANAQNFYNGTITTINQKAGACRVRCVRRD